MIYIRVDGNGTIGMGHVMRCLSIAEALREKGQNPVFITACKESGELLFDRGYNTFVLTTDYRDMDAEGSELAKILTKDSKETNVILIDSYQVTETYIEEMKNYGKVVCMDDEGRCLPADMIVNYNIYARELPFVFDGVKPELLLGADYVPLRKEFTMDCEYTLREVPQDILLTTGGGDPLFAAPKLLDALLSNGMLKRKNLRYHVVSGPVNQHAKELKALYQKHPQVQIHENVTNMKELMQGCDVLITAAGSTVYEACALGIPMICFYFVENQRRIAEYFDKNTDVINCGDYAQYPQLVCENLADSVVRCVYGRETRKELYEQERKIVDGLGAGRIADKLIEKMRK